MKPFFTSPGMPAPMGPARTREGFNFALFARHAEAVSLVFYRSGEVGKFAEIELDPELNRTGDIWHILIHDLNPDLRYGYRVKGPWDPDNTGDRYREDIILLDPYSRALTGSSTWGKRYYRGKGDPSDSAFQRRGCLVTDEFDWEGDRPLKIPLKDSIIYELQVRGFTRHPSSGVKYPGTFSGIIEKIPYLRQLGITAVELLPITEFDEFENNNRNPDSGEALKNFWGYSPLAFFAPKASYAVNGRNGNQVREFRELVKALHRAGIEVILDIVFNHTAEGDGRGPVISFKGLDNSIYYMLDRNSRDYLNFSGCGNTLNCNHPLVRNLIMDCLRYWVVMMHVDGFRFDLASVLGRDPQGRVLENPPMIEQIAEDPVLADTKIIAEAWDAAGLYQVGSFSANPRWAEWNGRFRDDIRAFMAGQDNMVAQLATRLSGSADLYQRQGMAPFNSINFITSHDGFTLADLVSYNSKHNEANGEGNRDGENNNISWNSGVEGSSSDPVIRELRTRRAKTMAMILLLSQGTPMLVAGDEFGRSQLGNNNAYCQDNELSWLDWELLDENVEMFRFVQKLISLRRRHLLFRRASFFEGADEEAPVEISWHSLDPDKTDWSSECRTLAFVLYGGEGPARTDDDFLVILNGGLKPVLFTLPSPPEGRVWCRIIDSGQSYPADLIDKKPWKHKKATINGMAGLVFISKKPGEL